MNGSALAERGKGLEDAFFAKQDAMLRQRLADLDAAQDRRAALAKASGVKDEAVLDKLMSLNLSSALMAAVALVPLVTIAWCDGKIEPDERKVLLESAERSGLDKAHPGYALFSGWLERKPPAQLFETWRSYMTALLPALSTDERGRLESDLLGRSRAVADAAGGFLGLGGRTSSAEKSVLKEIERVFEA